MILVCQVNKWATGGSHTDQHCHCCRGKIAINENEDNSQQPEHSEEEEEVAWLDNGPLHMLHIHCLHNKGLPGFIIQDSRS